MANKYLRLVLAVVVVMGVFLLAKGRVAWAGSESAAAPAVVEPQGEVSVSYALEPGSVKPPPSKLSICTDGVYSVGGVVVLYVGNLTSGYCLEAELSNPVFKSNLLPEEAGKPLAHLLLIRFYDGGKLIYELPSADGRVEACYALPPGRQAKFYFYDYFGQRLNNRTESPGSWDPIETKVDADNKTACAFTQVSGVYGLIGK